MNAVVLRELGEPEVLKLEKLPDPVPGPGDVVVRLNAAALNHRDIWIRRGRYAGIRLPIVLGSDGSGVVESVGTSADRSLVGRAVVINPSLDWGTDTRVQSANFRILGLPDNGTYAERVAVPAENVVAKPEALSFEEAAAVPLASLTAYRAVVTRAAVSPGETVLVTGIGGGVALFVMQMCLVRGATVLVTSGSDEKIERAKALGASGGANYASGDWVKAILEKTSGRGPDVIIDSIGGETFERSLELVCPGGRIVTFGSTTGAARSIEVRRIFWKQLSVLGSTMGTPEEFSSALAFYSTGSLKPVIDRTFQLADAAHAHRRMEAAEQFGKIVLRIQ